jgi:hypothetical protein
MRSEPAFTSIVCGIDGSPAALEAGAPGSNGLPAEASLRLAAIVAGPVDSDARSGIDEFRAGEALAHASDEVSA